MKKILSVLLLITFVLISCGTSNNVSNNRLIQKRKHNKGFHFNYRTSQKNQNTFSQDEANEVNSKTSETELLLINSFESTVTSDDKFEQVHHKAQLSPSKYAFNKTKQIAKSTSQRAKSTILDINPKYFKSKLIPKEISLKKKQLNITKEDEETNAEEKPKWKKFRNGSLLFLGISIALIGGSFIFSSWLYYLILLTVGAGLIALLISLILGIISINEKRKLPKVEKIKRESKQPTWKIIGWVALGFLLLGVLFFIIGLAPMSGIASPLGTLSVLIAIILGIITLTKGISYKKSKLQE